MKLRDVRFLADENISSIVCRHLIDSGVDVIAASEANLNGRPDDVILDHASRDSRAVLTHDSDFGKLAVASNSPYFGIVYLRPGHISDENAIASMEFALQKNPELNPPFIIVLANYFDVVKMRVRQPR